MKNKSNLYQKHFKPSPDHVLNNKETLLSSNLNGEEFKVYLGLIYDLNHWDYVSKDTYCKAIAKLASLNLLPDWFLSNYTPYVKSRDWTLILNSGGMQDTLPRCVNQLYQSLTHERSLLKNIENLPNKDEFINEILETGLWQGNIAFIWSHDHPDFEMCTYPPGWSQKTSITPNVVIEV